MKRGPFPSFLHCFMVFGRTPQSRAAAAVLNGFVDVFMNDDSSFPAVEADWTSCGHQHRRNSLRQSVRGLKLSLAPRRARHRFFFGWRPVRPHVCARLHTLPQVMQAHPRPKRTGASSRAAAIASAHARQAACRRMGGGASAIGAVAAPYRRYAASVTTFSLAAISACCSIQLPIFCISSVSQ